MNLIRPILQTIPPVASVRRKLGRALREVDLLQRLLRVAERAEFYRECDRQADKRRAVHLVSPQRGVGRG
jgi:hypothetical protein